MTTKKEPPVTGPFWYHLLLFPYYYPGFISSDQMAWAIRWVCRDCGVAWGHPILTSGEGINSVGGPKAVCPDCGVSVSENGTRRIGRQRWWGWEWKAESCLPPAFRDQPPLRQDKVYTEAEFDARVHAAVEVELTARLAQGAQ